jgi:hypothetical protein
MLVLDTTTKTMTAAMAGAATTTNPAFVTAYSDDTGTSFVEGSSDGALSGSSQVTLVAAPAASTRRLIKTIYIANTDTVANTITVTLNDNGTLRVIAKVTLQVGDTWSTDGTTDINGALKTTVGSVNLANVTGTLGVINGGTGVTTSTGTGSVVLSTSPTLVTPALGTPSSGVVTNLTGTASININGTVGATTASTGAFTYISTSGSTSTTPVLSFNASNSPISAGATISGSYLQFVMQNKSATANASTNYVLSNDSGTDSTYYGEFGINSSVFSTSTPADFFSINNGVYFSGHDGDVSIGSGNGFKTYIAWGTTGQSAHVVNATGALGFSTNLGTTPALSGTTGYGTVGQTILSGGSTAATSWGILTGTGGGTGVNNGSNTITLGGSFTTSGAFTTTFTATANTSVTLPTTGTLATLAGSETFTNKTLTNPTVTAYLETAPSITNSSTAVTISLSSGTVLSYTLTGNCTFTMPTATSGTSFIVKLIQDGTGSRTVTFTGVKWPGGTAPTITTTATTGLDILSFVCINSVWYGTYAQAFA